MPSSLTAAQAKAFHQAVAALAASCGPTCEATTYGGNRLSFYAAVLRDGLAIAQACGDTAEETLAALTEKLAGLVTYATAAQKESLQRLANAVEVSRAEKTAILLDLNRYTEAQATALIDDWRQEIQRRYAAKRGFVVTGEVILVAA
jgi:hypothetical protein